MRDFVNKIGHEALGKRLINSKDGKVQFEKPAMGLEVLMTYGRALVGEQDNVKRVQLAGETTASSCGAGGAGREALDRVMKEW